MTAEQTEAKLTLPSEQIAEWAQEACVARKGGEPITIERVNAIIRYLDEQHAAGQGSRGARYCSAHGGYGFQSDCLDCAVSRVEGAAEAKPEPTCYHHRYTQDCPKCAHAPVAEPSPPVAGEPPDGDSTCMCGSALREHDEYTGHAFERMPQQGDEVEEQPTRSNMVGTGDVRFAKGTLDR